VLEQGSEPDRIGLDVIEERAEPGGKPVVRVVHRGFGDGRHDVIARLP
jgi:hypothetical protein